MCRSTRARPLPVLQHQYTTPASTTPPTRPAPITTMVQTRPLHILCPPVSSFPYHDGSDRTAPKWPFPAVSCLVYFHDSDPHPPSSLAQPPPSYATTGPTAIQPKRPRTYRPTTNPPSHDHPPSTTTSYILEIDRRSCDSEVAKRCSRHRNRGGRDDGRDHLRLATPLAPASASRIATNGGI